MLNLPIQQSLLDLSLAIEFLVDNDFLDDVEIREGQAEEEERRRRVEAGRIVMLTDNAQEPADGEQSEIELDMTLEPMQGRMIDMEETLP